MKTKHKKEEKATKTLGGGIQAKLMGVLIPIIIIVIVSILVIVQSTTKQILRENSEFLLKTSADSAVNDVSAWMNEILGKLDAQRDVFEYMDMTPQEQQAYVNHTVDPNSSCSSGIYIATENKEVYATWEVPEGDYDPTTRGWYKEGLTHDKFMFGDAYLDLTINKIVTSATCVLKNRDGSVRGVAAGDVQLEEISKMCGEVKSKKDDKTASTPLVTVSDLQRMKQFEVIIMRMRKNPFKTKFVPQKRIDDLLCCIEGSFPEEYKEYIKTYGGSNLTGYKAYQKLLTAIRRKAFLSPESYSIKTEDVFYQIKAFQSTLKSDLKKVCESNNNMF